MRKYIFLTILTSFLFFYILLVLNGCKRINGDSNQKSANLSDSLNLYKQVLYSQFDISNFYSNSLFVNKDILLLNSNDEKVKLESLITHSHTVVFRFNENNSCLSCVNNTFIDLAMIEHKELIKLVVIVDSTSLVQRKVVSNRFNTEVYSIIGKSDIFPFGHNISFPYVLLFSNKKANSFFILGPNSKRYYKIFNDFLEEIVSK